MRTQNRSLSESTLRYLGRIADLVSEGADIEITLRLVDGGVKTYRESRNVRAGELAESDPVLVRELERG